MDFIADGFIQAFRLLFSMDEETMNILVTTLQLTAVSMGGILLLGLPLGFLLGYFDFPGKRCVRTVVDTLLALPTVVIGLLVYAFISRRGPLGGWDLLFTIEGMAIGQIILGTPIVVAYTATAIEGLDNRLRQTLMTLGASGAKLAMTSLWEARFLVLVAALTAFGRIVGEVGSAMMLGGNIKWHTRTITTAITLETGKGDFALGIALGVILILISLILNISLTFLRRRTQN
ncbi:ABC transporter permease [Cloacibacillus porcorum]|jgi:tungstate transport system permease protein|uniref:ABC transporter permease n=1 Tax=Cloacibacillus porcorum TaxID=1197717 RepID=A0A1B2I246_9BACT|nr:ABC transporter permease [Cloacibacillus porcorum]ANZ44032.1 ABC transporter permease [Cloacibacillus porcorum]MCD8234799.1 ABC transporter permease [Cloacibacillus porcorum]MDD7649073.1 ABC transporter permease [Cloacibacillus porcorum]MDY4094574.1 ABC transporter permease [Cloacibacillus porcorum]